MKQIDAKFPSKLQFLFRPYRYKVARGGRGSAKSWSFARALLLLGAKRPLRILCAREVQLSIKQSVHQLLKDQIRLLGLEGRYTVLDSEIRGSNGTKIVFTGLSTLTTDTIKSFEGIDICWVEEGQTISKRSWAILLPTIRRESHIFESGVSSSEIWVSYNPDLESDETHQLFTINKPRDCVNTLMNWRDNPWFNDVLNEERLRCLETEPDAYPNIWEGRCRPAVEGAIYYKQIEEMENQGRICNIPYDPMLKVHLVFDLGFTDKMSIGLVQKNLSELRLFDYIGGTRRSLSDYDLELKAKPYNWGSVFLPHDGFSKGHQTGQSTADVLKTFGWDVIPRENIVEMTVEEGIRNTRLKLPRLYIDESRCAPVVESLKRYRRTINKRTDAEGRPVHDQYSHDADMVRYLCLNEENMINEKVYRHTKEYAPRMGGWMGA